MASLSVATTVCKPVSKHLSYTLFIIAFPAIFFRGLPGNRLLLSLAGITIRVSVFPLNIQFTPILKLHIHQLIISYFFFQNPKHHLSLICSPRSQPLASTMHHRSYLLFFFRLHFRFSILRLPLAKRKASSRSLSPIRPYHHGLFRLLYHPSKKIQARQLEHRIQSR